MLHSILNDAPNTQLVLIIVPGKIDIYEQRIHSSGKNAGYYSEVKRVGDTELGVMTQVLCGQTCIKALRNTATMLNLLLKINTKCGGQNVSIPTRIRSPIMNEPVIVMGADVTHPAAGEVTRPSIAAIVGSLDPVPCKFVVSKHGFQTFSQKKALASG